jgi:hypothetical protein
MATFSLAVRSSPHRAIIGTDEGGTARSKPPVYSRYTPKARKVRTAGKGDTVMLTGNDSNDNKITVQVNKMTVNDHVKRRVIMSQPATMDAQKWADPATTPNNDGS